MPAVRNRIPANVIVFGIVSFLTDVSSDMIYPLLPIFLTQYLGAAQGFVGLVEGFAESTAAFFTLLSGFWTDRLKDRSRLVLAGYSISSLSRPLVALAWHPWVVFFVRFADRMGKGIRTSPRDALISDSVSPSSRGMAFGFQRTLDNAGAVTGPLLASLLLAYWIKDLRHLFALAAIPAVMAVTLIAAKVREVLPSDRPLRSGKFQLKAPPGKLRIYLSILFIFILSCSSDAFLILRAAQLGVSKPLLPILWMVFNAIKAGTNIPLGMLSDRIGRRRVILMGWILYALVYVGFAWAHETWHVWALFIAYGFFFGFTEGSERALLADFSGSGDRGQTFGWYYFVVGLGALPASLLFGFIWQTAGPQSAFLISAFISAIAACLLFLFLIFVPSATLKRSSS